MKKFLLLLSSCILIVSFALPTSAAPASNITVTWNEDSTSVEVTSDKDLSNVVVKDCAGVEYKYDNLNQGTTGTFTHPSGEPITTVWVKSGNSDSDDGPGYGQRFDNPNKDVCGESTPTTTTEPGATVTTQPGATVTTQPGISPTTAPTQTESPKRVPKSPATTSPKELPPTGNGIALLTVLGLGFVFLGALAARQ